MYAYNYSIHIREEAVDKAQVQTGLHPKSLPMSIRFENRRVHSNQRLIDESVASILRKLSGQTGRRQ